VVGLTSGDYTVEFWAKPDPAQAGNASILDSHSGLSGWSFHQVGLTSNRYQWTVFNAGGGHFSSSFIMPSGAWHHVAVTYNSKTKSLFVYLDGQLVSSQSDVANPASPLDKMYFGRAVGGGGFWSGMLRFVRFSSVVRYANVPSSGATGLTPVAKYFGDRSAVSSSFNLGPDALSFTVPQGPYVPDSASIAIWNLDTGTGTTVIDATSNHLNGSFDGTVSEPAWADVDLPAPTPVAAVLSATLPAATPIPVAPVAQFPVSGAGRTAEQTDIFAILVGVCVVSLVIGMRRRQRRK
jgi:hypothetical protein